MQKSEKQKYILNVACHFVIEAKSKSVLLRLKDRKWV